jgi:hypothetical protein
LVNFAELQRTQEAESFKNGVFSVGMKPAYIQARSRTTEGGLRE